MKLLILMFAATVMFAGDTPKQDVPKSPDANAKLQAEIDTLKADLALAKSRWAQCMQEMEIWNSIPIMQTRLNLAIEVERAKGREEAARKQTPPASKPAN